MKQLLALFLSVLIICPPGYAAFGAATAFDVNSSTGADTQGGGFDSGVGSPGTNESVGSGVAITVTLASGTTGTGSPAFSSTTHGPGNFVHIASGSGCTTGWFEILSQSSGTATFDHSMGSATDVCVGTIGGSLATLAQANTLAVSGNTIFCTGTFTLTSSLTYTLATITLTGYGTVHSDNNRCNITTATNSVVLINTGAATNGVQTFNNLAFTTTAGTPTSGIWQDGGHGTGQYWVFNNVLFNGFTSCVDDSDGTPFDVAYISVGNNSEFENCSTAGIKLSGSSTTLVLTVENSYFHGNAAHISGASNYTTGLFRNNVFGAATGSGVAASFIYSDFDHNSFSAIAGGAVSAGETGAVILKFSNNVFYGNTGAINVVATTPAAVQSYANATAVNNAFGSGDTNTRFAGNSSNISLSVNPFTNPSGGNFALNGTTGGGALLKGKASPATFGSSTANGLDVGAVQTVCSGGSSAFACGFSMLIEPAYRFPLAPAFR